MDRLDKFIRINADEMLFLKRKAINLDMVFSSPNSVLRSILGWELKNKSGQLNKTKGLIKIRIEDEVLQQLKSRAKEFNMNDIRPLDQLLKKILKSELEDEKKDEEKNDIRARRRPRTKRRLM